MSAVLLVVPWLAVRYLLPALAGGDGSRRAAHVAFGERDWTARAAYNLLTVAVVLIPAALSIRATGAPLWAGIALYAAGLALDVRATWDFCHVGPHGFSDDGLYRASRNPMYVAYLLVLLGIAALAASPAMLALVVGFQAAGHRLVLSEQRACLERFGEPYARYMGRTRRYL